MGSVINMLLQQGLIHVFPLYSSGVAAPSDYPEIIESNKDVRQLRGSFFVLFLFTKSYTLFMNIILCCWHVKWHLLTDMVNMLTNIVNFTISNEAWSTCWLDSRAICWHEGAFIHQSISTAESPPQGMCHPRRTKC